MCSRHVHIVVEAYSDAEWTKVEVDRRSTCYFTMFDGDLVSWKSNKQPEVGRSSSKAEY